MRLEGPIVRFDLTRRVAVVTGAANGLGRAFAEALIASGAEVACLDRDGFRLREAVSELGPGALAVEADLADEDAVERAVLAVTRWRDKIDVLVNNAGIATPPARLGEVSIADWDRTIGANLRSVFLCTRAFLPALLRGDRGAIVNIASYLGLKGVYPGFPVTAMPYGVTKAAIIQMTRQLALEYADRGLRVNAIAPGWHLGTQLGRERRAVASRAEDENFIEFVGNCAPIGRAGIPEELADLMLFLASDASRYITGQVVAHDGGLMAA